jgi:hypothetical protein
LAFYLWPFDHSKTRDIIADVLKKKNVKRPWNFGQYQKSRMCNRSRFKSNQMFF